MKYKYCRNCEHRCRCCASSTYEHFIRCSGCENHYDEFFPAYWIVYCPRLGVPVVELENKQ